MKIKILVVLFLLLLMSIYSQEIPEIDTFEEDCLRIWPDLLRINVEHFSSFSVLISRSLITEYFFDKTNIKDGNILLKSNPSNILSYKNPDGMIMTLSIGGGSLPIFDGFQISQNDDYLDLGNELNEAGAILSICIPNADNIYIYRKSGFVKDGIRCKLTFKYGTYEIVDQEFYYIGKNTEALSDLHVYNSDFSSQLGIVKKSSNIILIGWMPGRALIRTSVGLVGWVKLEEVVEKSLVEDPLVYLMNYNIKYFNYSTYN